MNRRTFLSTTALAVTGMRALAQETMVLQQTPSLDSIEEKPRKVPVVKACDVCVLGGGCTGVFAAVRAAQMGARVALVEKQNAFGGMATAGIVNVWHKLISNSQDRKQIIGGLTEQVIKKLELLGAVNSDAHGFYLNTEELKIELDALVLEHKITPYLNTVYVGAQLQHNQINAVFIENKNGRQAIRAKVFIDATGDGDINPTSVEETDE